MKKIFATLIVLLFLIFCSRISSNAYDPYMPDIDPQTGEFYDLWIDSRVELVKRTDPGPLYVTNTTLKLGGPRLMNYTELYGFKQSSEQPYAEDSMIFSFTNQSWGRFEVDTTLSFNNCIDLHYESNPSKSNYISTMCYKNTYIQDGDQNVTAYSPVANSYVKFDYNNHNDNVIQFLSTAFDKYESKHPSYPNGPIYNRVNFLIYDYQNESPRTNSASFSNVEYFASGITQGLSNTQEGELCGSVTTPQKQINIQVPGTDPRPWGSSAYSADNKINYCGFAYHPSFLTTGFISLWMDGGIPLPENPIYPKPSPTATPTPTAAVTPVPTVVPVMKKCRPIKKYPTSDRVDSKAEYSRRCLPISK